MQITQESKTQLAKLLATENLIVEHKKVSTAYFDTKNRKLVVPILKDGLTSDMYDLFIGHEVGHALNTPAEGWHDSIIDLKIPKAILNIVEDARIEKLIKRKYPGLRSSFSKAYRELVARNFFETDGVDLDAMNILDRLNMHFKGGASLNIKFTSEEMLIVSEMEQLETFDDVVTLSKKIMALYRQEKKNRQEKQKAEEPTEDLDDDTNYESPEEKFEDFSDDETEQEEGDSEEESEEDESEEDKKFEESEERGNENDGSEEDDEDDLDIESYTDDAFRKNEKELISINAKNYIYGNIPEDIDLSKIVVPYKYILKRHKSDSYHGARVDTQIFNDFRVKSGKVVSYLVKEFELRKNADQMKRASVSKTGDLNMSKIYSYKFNDDIFKRLTVVPGGKSHGLVMFLDWSGSMVNHLYPTIKQLLNLILFCKKVNIPFEVYAFTDRFFSEYNSSSKEKFDTTYAVNYKEGDVKFKHLHLMNFFSSKMNAAELSYMASMLLEGSQKMYGGSRYRKCLAFPDWMNMQYTPLNESIFCAMKIVPQFQKENKLEIVNTVFLTDGEGHQLIAMHGRPTNEYFHTNSQTQAILRHVKSGFSEAIPNQSGEAYTSAALKIFKNVTKTNVVGFYLMHTREFRESATRLFPSAANIDALRDTFMKEKSVTCTTGGYDEYYLIRADTDIDEDSELEVKSTTTRGLVNAFTKYNTSKIINRVILNKFIGMIA